MPYLLLAIRASPASTRIPLGIDAAGVVAESQSPDFKVAIRCLLPATTGNEHLRRLAEYIRVPASG